MAAGVGWDALARALGAVAQSIPQYGQMKDLEMQRKRQALIDALNQQHQEQQLALQQQGIGIQQSQEQRMSTNDALTRALKIAGSMPEKGVEETPALAEEFARHPALRDIISRPGMLTGGIDAVPPLQGQDPFAGIVPQARAPIEQGKRIYGPPDSEKQRLGHERALTEIQLEEFKQNQINQRMSANRASRERIAAKVAELRQQSIDLGKQGLGIQAQRANQEAERLDIDRGRLDQLIENDYNELQLGYARVKAANERAVLGAESRAGQPVIPFVRPVGMAAPVTPTTPPKLTKPSEVKPPPPKPKAQETKPPKFRFKK